MDFGRCFGVDLLHLRRRDKHDARWFHRSKGIPRHSHYVHPCLRPLCLHFLLDCYYLFKRRKWAELYSELLNTLHFKIMSNDVKKKEKVANDKVRTIKKEINELIRPLAQALERLQALRCSVDSVFNFLQGSFLRVFRYESARYHFISTQLKDRLE